MLPLMLPSQINFWNILTLSFCHSIWCILVNIFVYLKNSSSRINPGNQWGDRYHNEITLTSSHVFLINLRELYKLSLMVFYLDCLVHLYLM